MVFTDFPREEQIWNFAFISVDKNLQANTYVQGVTPVVSVSVPPPPATWLDGVTDTGAGIISAKTDPSNLLSNPTFESNQKLAHWDPNDSGLVVWTDNLALIQSGTGAVLMLAGGNMIHGDRVLRIGHAHRWQTATAPHDSRPQ